MTQPLRHLLRFCGRHLLVLAAIAVVFGSQVRLDHMVAAWLAGDQGSAISALNGDQAPISPCDPDDADNCGRCHCPSASALLVDAHLPILMTTTAHQMRTQHRGIAPDDWSFAPDPPPNRV